jgi:signal transduction histidine kinase
MFTTIRSKLLVIFLSFVLVTVITSIIVFNYFEKNKDSLSRITEKAENTHVLLLKDLKVIHDFFENETIDTAFFETGNSDLINTHQKLDSEISNALYHLNIAQKENEFGLNDTIENLKKDFKKYETLTNDIIKQILIRGFKDYGIEGKMRSYAHELENFSKEIGLVNILQLRRNEKDFIIRQEDRYLTKHQALVNEIKDNLSINNSINSTIKTKIINTLNNYVNNFNTLVLYEKKLGLKNGKGLKKQVDSISNRIESSLALMVGFSEKKVELALFNIKMVYTSIGLIFIIIGIISALIISKTVSRSITNLKEKIDEFVKSDFTVRTILPLNNSDNEIDILTTNFSVMEQHIVNQMSSLKQSNKDLEMLFYVTSHDIRPPLLKVKELTTHAFVKTNDVEVKEALYQINLSWEKLLNITDELGIVTNIRSVEIKTELIDLEKLINSVFSEFHSLQWFDNIIFSMDLKMKNKFYSSPGLVKAIFRNLIENSIKYSTKRESFSFLKISIVDQNDEMLRIEVSDNGIGIKKEFQDKIFDMFFRGTEYASGTGLGLYIVKCSLEKLNGAISVESSEKSGTTFTMMLPTNYKRKNIKERIIHNREISELANNSVINSNE